MRSFAVGRVEQAAGWRTWLGRVVAGVVSDRTDKLTHAEAALMLGVTHRAVATMVRRGDVTVVGHEERVTPNQAAGILGMSRTHLYKLLDAGWIPYVMVGRDRLIDITAVRQFRDRMDADRADLVSRSASRDRSRAALLDFAR